MTKYIIRRLNSTKDDISMYNKEISYRLTGMYTKMNNIIDKASMSGKEIDVNIAIEKLQALHNKVVSMISTMPKEYDLNIKDANKLLVQIQDNIKFLKRTFLEDSINDSVDANVDFAYLLSEERKAVEDYRKAIASTTDKNQLYVLSHILKEEAHHIELLENLQKGKVEFKDAAPGVDIKKYEALIDEYAYKKPGKEDLQDIVDRFKLNRQTMAQMLVFWGYLDMWDKLKYYE